MTVKRKFVEDLEDNASLSHTAKQLKLVPFPNYQEDEDSVMSDVQPLSYHTRLPSNVSFASSSSDDSASPYPAFNQCALPFFASDANGDPNSHDFTHSAAQQQAPTTPVGLLQPSSAFSHHGSGCSQIPKLKVACASGLNGQRTMWSFCEQCGAISMVDGSSS